MNPIQSCLGVFAVIGRWPNWERYFDLSRKGLKLSLVILAICLVPLWLVAWSVRIEHTGLSGVAFTPPDLLRFTLTVGLLLFSFPAMAYLFAMVFEKMDRLRPWIITRNWAVFCLSIVTGGAFGLYLLGLLPFVIATGIAFASFMGLLVIDIRLTHKVVGFPLGMSILVSCVNVCVGLTFLILSMSY